jgi:hypothetical protein
MKKNPALRVIDFVDEEFELARLHSSRRGTSKFQHLAYLDSVVFDFYNVIMCP